MSYEDYLDVLAYCGTSIPGRVLRAHGFHFDGRPPPSWVTSPTTFVAYDLTGDDDPSWRVGGLDLRDDRNWGCPTRNSTPVR